MTKANYNYICIKTKTEKLINTQIIQALDITVKSHIMTKIEIVDCCNFEHKISLMIKEARMELSSDVYFAVGKYEGISSKQAKKIQDFRNSCPGPIMVKDYYCDDNGAQYIEGRDFEWTSYDVYEAAGFIFVHYSTRVQGDHDILARIEKANYKGLESFREDFGRWRAIGQRNFEVIWRGSKIY